MLAHILPAPIIGVISFLLHMINTFFWFVPIVFFALIKLLLPISFITKTCTFFLDGSATAWISVNTGITQLTKKVNWDISLPENLSTKEWYLVIANHQSWVDILAIQQVLNRKVPFLKFFLKQELIWVPVLGIAWWALDFPFMKRFTKSYLKKNPHMKGKDFETTKKACEKFKTLPISVMNYAEGTRFTSEKHQKQNSPFNNLLKPKSGGIGYVLTLMGDEINQVLDVTIDYPDSKSFTFWDYMCGRVKTIHVDAKVIPIPQDIKGNYIDDSDNRRAVQQWVNQMWEDKDRHLDELRGSTVKANNSL